MPHIKNNPSASTLTQYVNPFIGTAAGGAHFGFGGNSGDTFLGATYPAVYRATMMVEQCPPGMSSQHKARDNTCIYAGKTCNNLGKWERE